MSQGPEPDWSALPDRPLDFFGLEPDFDRIALKRAYNKLLRHYKPEKFPAEFQRLRAAYEHLEEMLRYGDASAATTSFFPAALPIPSALRKEKPAPEPAPLSLDVAALVGNTALAEVRQRLRTHPVKSPEEWIQLALLNEELEPDDPLSLYGPLIEAIPATQGSGIVAHFLSEACREALPPEAATRLLLKLTKLTTGSGRRPGLDPNWYYYLTEKLWTDLLPQVRFEDYADLLGRCRGEVGSDGFLGYTVLLIRLLRHGVLHVSAEWRDDAIGVISGAFHQLPADLQNDINLFDWLDRYRQKREEFLGVHPWREVYDEALMRILAGDEVEADHAFLRAQVSALDEPEALFEAFPIEGNFIARDSHHEDLAYAWEPLLWYADDVADRSETIHAAQSDPADPAEVKDQIHEFFRQIEKHTDKSALGRMWNFFGFFILILHIALAVLPFFFVSRADESAKDAVIILSIIWATLCVAAFVRHWWHFALQRVPLFFANKLYKKLWRGEIATFLANTHIPLDEFERVLVEMNEDDITNDAFILAAVNRDAGMLFYSLALRFAN